jgi:hypothetical protein
MMTRRLGPEWSATLVGFRTALFVLEHCGRSEGSSLRRKVFNRAIEATSFGRIVRVIGNWPGDDSDL